MSVLKNVDQGISTNDSKYVFDFPFEMNEEVKRKEMKLTEGKEKGTD